MSQGWSVIYEWFYIIICCHNDACLSVYCLIWALCSSDQVKADRHSKKLSVLQHASRNVNEMAANVVASTRTGQENLEEKGEYRLTCEYTLRSVSSITQTCVPYRYHGLFWAVSHQVEERRDGVTGESWRWFQLRKFLLFLFKWSKSSSQTIKKWFQQRLKPPVDIPLFRWRCSN